MGLDQEYRDHAEITCLRAEIDAKSAEIVELQTELHRLRPVADQVDGMRAELDEIECRYENHIDEIMRHNWKETARLREALEPLLRLAERYDAKYTELGSALPREIVDARAALAHLPQEEPSR